MSRPKIAPDLAAALTAAIPARLVKKLDAEPALAAAWAWAAATVTTDKGDVVQLTVDGDAVTALACSCLLSPRCLHIAAVVALLEPTEPLAQEPDIDGPDSAPSPRDAASAASSERPATAAIPGERHVAAERAFGVLADLLAIGAEASGALPQAELLRSIHACRTDGLHRLAAAQTRMLRSIRELRADRPSFTLDALTADLREALTVAHDLAASAHDERSEILGALRGSARREYESIGNLRLHGVFTEAVVARSGYAGAITYLADERGALYTRADVAPGDASRAAAAYDAAAGIGDAVLPHRELCRSGLFVSGATASASGRLGAGQQVRAVRATEPARWDRDPIDARFRVPVAEQLAQIAAHDAAPDELRPAGWNLVFVAGTLSETRTESRRSVSLAIADPGAPASDAAPRVLELVAAPHPALLARDNLIALSRAPGLRLRAIGRARLGQPRELDLLAIAPAPGESRFSLPASWHGRANIHYDRLALPPSSSDAHATPLPAPTSDLLAPLRRRIERAALGGAASLPAHALPDLEREAAALAERALGGAATVLRALAAVALAADRAATGARKSLDRTAFAHAWLRAALYEAAARRRLSIARW